MFKINVIILPILMGLNFCAFANVFKGIIKMNTKNGIFLTQDISKNPIILEWEEISGQTEQLSEKIKDIAAILVSAYTKTEVDFACKKPESVSSDFMLKSLAPILSQDIHKVDWGQFEAKTKNLLEQFFATTDWAKYSNAQDVNIFVIAIDQTTGDRLGVIQFLISPDFGPHNVKAALYGVAPFAQSRNLEYLLMSSIFKLKPDIKRVFLHTRSTNTDAISNYKYWGFTEFAGKLPNWTDLEYLTEHSNKLQKTSDSLVIQNN